MRILTLAALIPLAACVTTTSARSGPVAIGETQALGALRITPIAMVEDSRCPMNARCVWAGRAIVRATVSGPRIRADHDFTLGEPTTVGAHRLMLDSVTPEKMAGEATAPAVTRVHFSVVG